MPLASGGVGYDSLALCLELREVAEGGASGLDLGRQGGERTQLVALRRSSSVALTLTKTRALALALTLTVTLPLTLARRQEHESHS